MSVDDKLSILTSDFFDRDDIDLLTEDAGKILGCPLMVIDDTYRVAALMRPSKSVSDMELKSLKKKFKDKKFAAGCSREIISKGAEMLGWELDKLLGDTLEIMRSAEKAIANDYKELTGEEL